MRRLAIAACALGAALLNGCATAPTSQSGAILIMGCPIYADPDAAPIEDGAVVIEDGVIAAIGPRADIGAPAGAEMIFCEGGAIAPGFWNAHAHFFGLAGVDDDAVQVALDALSTQHGFTTVVDAGADLATTLALRARIEAGQLRGPRILTAGAPIVGPGGTPFYAPPGVRFPEAAGAGEASALAQADLAAGADLIKIMSVSLTSPQPPFVEMTPAAIVAVTETAHARGARVAAHPTTERGVRLAQENGVDLLTHTTPATGPWPSDLVEALVRDGVALTPTLSLWRYELAKSNAPTALADQWTATAEGQLRDFARAGGVVLFGTDAGYMTETDPLPEYESMARAGLSAEAVLRTMTSAPRRFFDGEAGPMLAPGMRADLVMLNGDPRTAGVRAFARPSVVVRGGRIIHDARP